MYHKGCWSSHVVNKFRTVASTQQEQKIRSVIEFGTPLPPWSIGVGSPAKNLANPNWFHLAEARKGPDQTPPSDNRGLQACYTPESCQILREKPSKNRTGNFEGDWPTLTFLPLVKRFRDLVVGGDGRNNPRNGEGSLDRRQVPHDKLLIASKLRRAPKASEPERPLRWRRRLAIHHGDAEQSMIKMFPASLAERCHAGTAEMEWSSRAASIGLLVHFASTHHRFRRRHVKRKTFSALIATNLCFTLWCPLTSSLPTHKGHNFSPIPFTTRRTHSERLSV
ncbi:hypothetical protein GWK47_011695 [Chionoecetes opilio]|uniref:Uncharacterized protein n=1 Tax=Chionoecetes opilio TaxID=41210 RepID=A0A8J5C2G9_CHIOP|nr:hypothetical protein GWK47_011695 [Chionoecetes opilio]